MANQLVSEPAVFAPALSPLGTMQLIDTDHVDDSLEAFKTRRHLLAEVDQDLSVPVLQRVFGQHNPGG